MPKILDKKLRQLIAVAASTAANCQVWLEYHYVKAREANASEDEIREAIDIGEMVKETTIMKNRELIDFLFNENAASKKPVE